MDGTGTPGARAAAPLRGLAMVSQAVPQLALFTVTATAIAVIPTGVGLLLLPPAVHATRLLARQARGQAGRWSGVGIEQPYRAVLAGRGIVGWWRRDMALLADPATWRDLLWTLLNPVIGTLLAILPLALVVFGVEGLVMPFIREPIDDAGGSLWYGFIHVRDATDALYAVPLGAAALVVGFLSGPALLRAHARWTRSLLGPVSAPKPSVMPVVYPAAA
ncbi:sensor domain-containing protein [Embleya hyalina]|uniref:Histidine kinase n=1 Tax=Embleya hyalina TaxID=516124 RepID=A0A401YUV5_9ACTN|nr:sensor domain-containing protein [Embleya hyalina]GCD98392.1 histidine kinase [Embleya hyalina]